MTERYETTPATELRRHPERGSYDRDVVHAILDEALVCHLAYVHEGVPFSMPTAYARSGETIYVHGARANRSLAALAAGAPFSVSVMLLDGLVLARTAFHHSMNYRSVVATGSARLVTTREEKRDAMTLLVDRMAVGRSLATRMPVDWELDVTQVLAIEIAHASAKTRSGGPLDLGSDRLHPCWSGVVPVRLALGAPIAEPDVDPALLAPVVSLGR